MRLVPGMESLPDVPWVDKLAYLTWKLSALPQLECPLEHIFDGDTYTREIRLSKGAVLIGRPHLQGHDCRLIEGKVVHITEHMSREVEAPFSMRSTPGYQMVIYALTDVVASTIHPVGEERDVQKLEAALFGSLEDLKEKGRIIHERTEYTKMLTDHGMDEDKLRPLIENTADQIPFHSEKASIGISKIDRQGFLATVDINNGEIISSARLGGMRTPAGRYTNHGSSPNAMMVQTKNNDVFLMSIQDIKAGEEITVDYRQAIETGRIS